MIEKQTQPKLRKLLDSRRLFGRLCVIAKARPFDLKDILGKPFSNIPLSLANTNGSLCKTSKVVLLHRIEELVPNKGKYLNQNVSIISDLMDRGRIL